MAVGFITPAVNNQIKFRKEKRAWRSNEWRNAIVGGTSEFFASYTLQTSSHESIPQIRASRLNDPGDRRRNFPKCPSSPPHHPSEQLCGTPFSAKLTHEASCTNGAGARMYTARSKFIPDGNDAADDVDRLLNRQVRSLRRWIREGVSRLAMGRGGGEGRGRGRARGSARETVTRLDEVQALRSAEALVEQLIGREGREL
ncbi:hypothetical protein KM043_005367 [Ampulex compressa]|nr:hypothetical protein KM043_005367 [Ampulex compressa]